MTWIKTVKPKDASPELLRAMEAQKELYPEEYAVPVQPYDRLPQHPLGSNSRRTRVPNPLNTPPPQQPEHPEHDTGV